ncbi:DUF389 domain-containing protein [Nocardia sp. CDC153]|uniref:DUF389 domain-containing protein n=1 Tax=Nocardia sp. CDC153 TaxID=3112167 RepID=UPI002DB846D4|nr:DUF389 domain-containing protein [Nocardia sp. CDC153]MEC3953483.1 DUF389 domain-containing protein [Nocardia sp. CDC153]
MLNVRVISPSDRTDAALTLLHGDAGATLITVQRGAAVEPAGDLIECVVARESADDVLTALTELGITRRGSIALREVDTLLSEVAEEAVESAPAPTSDSVVWQELVAQTGEAATLTPSFLAFITIACLLAVVGVATDSAVTIVGAMVVGPEFGPLAATAVALVRKDFRLAAHSALALLVGFPFAMGIAWPATLLFDYWGWISPDSLDHLRNVDFIYKVGPFSMVVALLAGAAGMLAIMTPKSAALVGVFISVTTIPAAGFAVVAATMGEWHKAFMSIGQLAVNMVGIVAAGTIVLWLRPRHMVRGGSLDRLRRWWLSDNA